MILIEGPYLMSFLAHTRWPSGSTKLRLWISANFVPFGVLKCYDHRTKY
jgi:hypothetical protein